MGKNYYSAASAIVQMPLTATSGQAPWGVWVEYKPIVSRMVGFVRCEYCNQLNSSNDLRCEYCLASLPLDKDNG